MRTETITSHSVTRDAKVNNGLPARISAKAEVHHFHWGVHDRKTINRKTRLFWTDKWDGSMLSEETVLGERPKVTRRGEFPDVDKAWDAYNKQHKRIVRDAIVATLNEMVGHRYEVKSSDVRYSRKAGCTCPCSPGFILSDDLTSALEQACGTAVGIADVRVTLRYYAPPRN